MNEIRVKVGNRAQLAQRLKEDQVDNVILVGNPGVGKSTILNSLMGEARFRSGVSASGVTEILQSQDFMGIKYVDTPGLDEYKKRKQAGEEIERALKQNGSMKLIFICVTEGGRVRSSDLATIDIVLGAFREGFKKNIRYGILVNKMDDENYEIIDEIIKQFDNVEIRTQHIDFMPRNNVYKGNNISADLPSGIIDFIYSIPTMRPNKDDVMKLVIDKYEERLDRTTKELLDMRQKYEDIIRKMGEIKVTPNSPRFTVGKGRKVHKKGCRIIRDNGGSGIRAKEYLKKDQCRICCDW